MSDVHRFAHIGDTAHIPYGWISPGHFNQALCKVTLPEGTEHRPVDWLSQPCAACVTAADVLITYLAHLSNQLQGHV